MINTIRFTKNTDVEVRNSRGNLEIDIFVEGEDVEVYNLSQNAESSTWTFGDGSPLAEAVSNECFEIVS